MPDKDSQSDSSNNLHPDIATLANQSEFASLSPEAQAKAVSHFLPDTAKLSPEGVKAFIAAHQKLQETTSAKSGSPDLGKIIEAQNAPIALPGRLGKAEDYINNAPYGIGNFRRGIEKIGQGLEHYALNNPNLSTPAKALVGGTGLLARQVPVGSNLRDTLAMAITPPELGAKELPLGKLGVEPGETWTPPDLTKKTADTGWKAPLQLGEPGPLTRTPEEAKFHELFGPEYAEAQALKEGKLGENKPTEEAKGTPGYGSLSEEAKGVLAAKHLKEVKKVGISE